MRTVEILLDGDRPRHLRFTIGALRKLQRASGMPLGPFAAMLSETSIEAYAQAIACGLEHEVPTITVDQAAEMIQMALDAGRPLKMVAEKITEAFIASGLFEDRKNAPAPTVTVPPPPESA